MPCSSSEGPTRGPLTRQNRLPWSPRWGMSCLAWPRAPSASSPQPRCVSCAAVVLEGAAVCDFVWLCDHFLGGVQDHWLQSHASLQDSSQGQSRRRLHQSASGADVHLQIQAVDAAHAAAINAQLQSAVSSGKLAVRRSAPELPACACCSARACKGIRVSCNLRRGTRVFLPWHAGSAAAARPGSGLHQGDVSGRDSAAQRAQRAGRRVKHWGGCWRRSCRRGGPGSGSGCCGDLDAQARQTGGG